MACYIGVDIVVITFVVIVSWYCVVFWWYYSCCWFSDILLAIVSTNSWYLDQVLLTTIIDNPTVLMPLTGCHCLMMLFCCIVIGDISVDANWPDCNHCCWHVVLNSVVDNFDVLLTVVVDDGVGQALLFCLVDSIVLIFCYSFDDDVLFIVLFWCWWVLMTYIGDIVLLMIVNYCSHYPLLLIDWWLRWLYCCVTQLLWWWRYRYLLRHLLWMIWPTVVMLFWTIIIGMTLGIVLPWCGMRWPLIVWYC